MGAIDVGNPAIDQDAFLASGATYLLLGNPANRSGKITSVEMYFTGNVTGVLVGMFYGSSSTYTCRDYASIGAVSGGSKQTASVEIDVVTGDLIGIYFEGAGSIEAKAYGTGARYYLKSGNQMEAGAVLYTGSSDLISLYGIGYAHDGSPMRGGFNGMRGGFIN